MGVKYFQRLSTNFRRILNGFGSERRIFELSRQQVHCQEHKTGQQRVQLYYGDNSLFPSSYIIYLCHKVLSKHRNVLTRYTVNLLKINKPTLRIIHFNYYQ